MMRLGLTLTWALRVPWAPKPGAQLKIYLRTHTDSAVSTRQAHDLSALTASSDATVLGSASSILLEIMTVLLGLRRGSFISVSPSSSRVRR